MTKPFADRMADYVDVAERIAEFRLRYPEGTIQAEVIELPAAFAGSFIAMKAYAYRSIGDPRPGIGHAWEPVPGKTPYTKDSELMNAETSAWGRAIVAALAADAKRGIASAEEVRNRSEAGHGVASHPGPASEHRSEPGTRSKTQRPPSWATGESAPGVRPASEPSGDAPGSDTSAAEALGADTEAGGANQAPLAEAPPPPQLETAIGVFGNITKTTFAAHKLFPTLIGGPNDLEKLTTAQLTRLIESKVGGKPA